MPRIMIRCPMLRTPVPTGLTTESVKFDSLTFKFSLRCPACKMDHDWSRVDAWVEKESDGN